MNLLIIFVERTKIIRVSLKAKNFEMLCAYLAFLKRIHSHSSFLNLKKKEAFLLIPVAEKKIRAHFPQCVASVHRDTYFHFDKRGE